jgi:NAD(P)H-flavin reductase
MRHDIIIFLRSKDLLNLVNKLILTIYLQIGDSLSVRGPIGKLNYLGRGEVLFKGTGKQKHYKRILMVAGGTGIAPHFQLI